MSSSSKLASEDDRISATAASSSCEVEKKEKKKSMSSSKSKKKAVSTLDCERTLRRWELGESYPASLSLAKIHALKQDIGQDMQQDMSEKQDVCSEPNHEGKQTSEVARASSIPCEVEKKEKKNKTSDVKEVKSKADSNNMTSGNAISRNTTSSNAMSNNATKETKETESKSRADYSNATSDDVTKETQLYYDNCPLGKLCKLDTFIEDEDTCDSLDHVDSYSKAKSASQYMTACLLTPK